ncbi:MAG: hypothetical protein HUJ89_00170 [Bacteroidales bacterium]|nr:hypothetical protein [Bacteroidales bacterium]
MKTLTTITGITLAAAIVSFSSCNKMQHPATHTKTQDMVKEKVIRFKTGSEVESTKLNAYVILRGKDNPLFCEVFRSNGNMLMSNNVTSLPALEDGAVMGVQAVSPSGINIEFDEFEYRVTGSADVDVKAGMKYFDKIGEDMDIDLESVMTKVGFRIRPEGAPELDYEIVAVVMENVVLGGRYNFASGRMRGTDEIGSIEIKDIGKDFYMIPQPTDKVRIVVDYKVHDNGRLIFKGSHETSKIGNMYQGGEFEYELILPPPRTEKNQLDQPCGKMGLKKP